MEQFGASPVFTLLMLFVATFIVTAVVRKYRFPRRYAGPKSSSKRPHLPPGPVGWPVIGSIPEMLSNRPTHRWIHDIMKKFNTDIACIRLGSTHVISVSCPEIAREILKQQDQVFMSRPVTYAQSVINKGYRSCALTPFSPQSQKMRKVLLTEILSPLRLQLMHDKRMEEADHLTAWVYNLCSASKPVSVRRVGRHYCGNLIKRLIFNRRYFGKATPDGGPGPDDEEHMEATFAGLAYLFSFAVSDYIPALTGLDVDGHERLVRRANSIMERYHDPVIEERMRARTGQKEQKMEDFLDVFISLKDDEGKPLLTPDDIKCQIKEIMIATVDNPSHAVEWVMAEMMNQPDILQKAVQELDEVVGRHRQVQESDIPRLNYVKACLREAFRLHPVVSFVLPHVALSDTTVAGYHIPKGSHILISRYGLGRNPNVWDDPLRFKPERHLDENSAVTLIEGDLRFVSFSAGRRGCVGPALGSVMTVMLLARLLHGYSWQTPTGSERVELVESHNDLFMAKPLALMATPRLPAEVYPKA